jgi:hypothetical protein
MLAAVSPAAGRPAPAIPVPASADADTRAFTLAMENQAAAWIEFRETLARVQVKVRAFADEYAAYRTLAAIPDARARAREARGRFGWMERETPDQLAAFDGAMKRLEIGGFDLAMRRATAELDRMSARVAATANAMEFAQEEARGDAGRGAARGWSALSGALSQAGKILNAQAPSLPSSPAIFLWTETLPEAGTLLAGAVAALDSTAHEFPGEALCAEPDRWRDAQRAFTEARAPTANHAPCGGFFLTAAFPRLRTPVWDGGAYLFLYDPAERVGRFADRARAALVYRWYPKLKSPPPLTPAWLAVRSAALDPNSIERARALHARFQGWRGEDGPDPRILINLGLVQSAREILRLDPETFTARYLLEAPFTAQVSELLRADERDGYASGWVIDALTGAPIIGARITFEADGRTVVAQSDTAGAFKAVFPRRAETQLRVVVSREGFQTITHTGPPPSPVLVPYDFKLSRLAGLFVVSGVVVGQGSGKPVQNAVVIAAAARGTSSRMYTGQDGTFRLVLDVAEGVPIEIRAQKGDAASQVKVTSRGAERSGIRLQLDAREGGTITQVWEVEDEGGTTAAEAELEEAPKQVATSKKAVTKSPTKKVTKPPADEPAAKPPADEPAAKPPADAVAKPPADEPAAKPPVGAARYLVLDGPPSRQSGAQGPACENLGGTLEIVPVAGAFPDTVIPGRTYRIEARIDYRPPVSISQRAYVAVRASFLDAESQSETIFFDGPGTRTVAFDFAAPGVDPTYGAGFAGVIAVYEIACEGGRGGTRTAMALQHYLRR